MDKAKEARNAYMRAYYRKNKEKIKEIQRRYWERKEVGRMIEVIGYYIPSGDGFAEIRANKTSKSYMVKSNKKIRYGTEVKCTLRQIGDIYEVVSMEPTGKEMRMICY